MRENDIYKKLAEENLYRKEDIRKKVLKMGGKKKSHNIIKIAIPAVTLGIILFVVGINTNKAFAEGVASIPFLKSIVQFVTIKEYTEDEDFGTIHVAMPNVTYEKNKQLEDKINNLIEEKMNEMSQEGIKRAREFKHDFLAMEGNKKFTPIKLDYNYEVKCTKDTTLSFVIHETIDYGIYDQPFNTCYFYNIDLNTEKNITLEMLYGNDYKEIIDKSIEEQVKERAKEDENLLSYYNEFYLKSNGIDENQMFFINEDNQPVIFFYEYVIAPGYAGDQEFIVPVDGSKVSDSGAKEEIIKADVEYSQLLDMESQTPSIVNGEINLPLGDLLERCVQFELYKEKYKDADAMYKKLITAAVTGGYNEAEKKENYYMNQDGIHLDGHAIDAYENFIYSHEESFTTQILQEYINLLIDNNKEVNKNLISYYNSFEEMLEDK